MIFWLKRGGMQPTDYLGTICRVPKHKLRDIALFRMIGHKQPASAFKHRACTEAGDLR